MNKLKHFFEKNKKTVFLVKDITKFLFLVGKYNFINPKQIFKFLFLNKKKNLKSNLYNLKKVFKMLNNVQKKMICPFATKKLFN